MNDRCVCVIDKFPFFCDRHSCRKSEREYELCSGVNCNEETSKSYWDGWESGKLQGSAALNRSETITSKTIQIQAGVGTELKKLFSKIGIVPTPNCSCNRHSSAMDYKGIEWCEENIDTILEWLKEESDKRKLPFSKFVTKKIVKIAINRAKKEKKKKLEEISEKKISKSEYGTFPVYPALFDASGYKSSVKNMDFANDIRRNLIYHVYPSKTLSEVWRWNLDQLLERINLFNGKKVVAIAHDKKSHHPDEVMSILDGHGIEFILLKNKPAKAEGISFIPLMESIASTKKKDVTFRAHAKGVTRNPRQFPTIKSWTQAMYIANLDNWDAVKLHLEKYSMTGAFRRIKPLGASPWHYSGSFYWFRNRDVFSKEWKVTKDARYDVEAWPGIMFPKKQVGCLFFDKVKHLYTVRYWIKSVENKFKALVEDNQKRRK